MKYPESVLTKNRKGETEVRRLLRKGSFIEYDYIYPESGKVAEKGKRSIILKSGREETHYFLIPLKGGKRFLAVVPEGENPERKVWNGKKAVSP